MTQGLLGLLALGLVLWVAVEDSRRLLRSEHPAAQATGWSFAAYVTVCLTTALSLMYLTGAQGFATTAAMVSLTVGLADSGVAAPWADPRQAERSVRQ